MKLFRLFLCFLLLFGPSIQAAQVIRYVDPDAAGAGTGVDWTNAYTSLSAWDSGEATDLVTDGDYHTVYCRSSGGTADTSTINIGVDWTLDSTHYIQIIGADFPADGIYDGTKYRIARTNNTLLDISAAPVYVINIQFELTVTAFASPYCIYFHSVTETDTVYVDSCICKGIITSSNAYPRAIYANAPNASIAIYNTIGYGFDYGTKSFDLRFIHMHQNSTCAVYNCTAWSNDYNYSIVAAGTGSLSIYNSIAADGATANFTNVTTIDYCCSDAGDGTHAQTPSGGSWANELNNTASGDFSLVSGGNCIGNGTDNPSSGLYSDDIIGTIRSSTWDIGAFEYEAAPPAAGGGQVIIIGMD